MGYDKDKIYRRNVYGLSLTSLLTDISSESVYAVLPFYIRSLGYGREIVGLIEGLGELLSSIFKLYSGYIAHKIKKYKLLVMLGYLLSALAKPFFIFTKTWYEIAVVKIVDRLGKGIRTSPRDALLAASASEEKRGRAFGIHRSLDTLGSTTGPFIAALLLPIFGFHGIFLFSLLPGLLAVFVLIIVVIEVSPIVEENKGLVKKTIRGHESGGFPSLFWLFISTIALSGLAGYTQAFLLIRAYEVGWSQEQSIFLLTMANIFYALLAYPVGYFSDRLGRGRSYPLVFILQALGALALIFSTNIYMGLVFFAIYGFYMAFHDTLMRILTSQYVPVHVRDKAYGIMHGTYGFSVLAGYFIVGVLYDYAGYVYAFTYTLTIAIIGFASSLILVSKS